jgi:hypothetical protein
VVATTGGPTTTNPKSEAAASGADGGGVSIVSSGTFRLEDFPLTKYGQGTCFHNMHSKPHIIHHRQFSTEERLRSVAHCEMHDQMDTWVA